MSTRIEEDIVQRTDNRKSALVLDIIQGKTTVVEARRADDLPSSEVEGWVENGQRGMENALRANRLDLKALQEACGMPAG
ncbi:transposase [Ralstonia pseudosolanacearum]|uniref:transposase n=1 Tax=Ralstonia pseudosolanacearum TaxID=1310165 RepID=UPI0018D00F7D|nr:transposase [Ralstonia pseudosolanacearum]